MYEKNILKIVEKNSERLGIDRTVRVRFLGTGENNRNYRIDSEKKSFVFRINVRDKLEPNMAKEFTALSLLPSGVGPKPLLIDRSKKDLPRTYCILSYVPGKRIFRWSDRHIIFHAQTIASVHKREYPYWTNDFLHRHAGLDVMEKFQKHTFETKDSHNEEIKRFLPKMRAFLTQHRKLLNIRTFSLVHGDLCVDNILFQGKSVRYIDWEWIRIQDPAADAAGFYFEDIAIYPWTIRLSRKRQNIFYSAYLRVRPDRTLRERAEVWNMYGLFTNMLFNRWKVVHYTEETTGLPKIFYQKAVEKMVSSLKKRI